jgi:hypothetical protein
MLIQAKDINDMEWFLMAALRDMEQ